MKKTIIVMPVANEESTMEGVIQTILNLPYDNLFFYPVIDDYSKDNTEQIIRRYENEFDRIKCIYYKESKGVISCYLEGFRQALKDGAEWILEMDGGGSHNPDQIPQFIDKLEAGYECVFGSRFMPGGAMVKQPLYRRLLSQGGTILANIVLGTKCYDMTSGFEAFDKHVLDKMRLDLFLSHGHMYQTEMRFYCRNYKWIEVPISYTGSTSSSLKLKSVTEALAILFKLKRYEKKVML